MVVHNDDGVCRCDNGEPKYFARRNQERILRPQSHKLMPLNPAANIEKQHGQTFALRIEIRICRDVTTPILRRAVGRIHHQQFFRSRALAQTHYFKLVRSCRETKRLHELFKPWEWWRRVHDKVRLRVFERRANSSRRCRADRRLKFHPKTFRKDVATPCADCSNENQVARATQ